MPAADKLLGNGPYPDSFKQKVDVFLSSEFAILKTKSPLSFISGKHVHDSFEFIIPSNSMDNHRLEGKDYYIPANRLFPINSGQFHGPGKPMYNISLLGVNIARDIINEAVYQFLGEAKYTLNMRVIMLIITS
ncbi:MAG: hypothetical protein JM58_02260 [Peptococcaceae bacterium BICA1-8]|nr:MAG: hypothetical protein JM58_02260 [Peptococcaceae bacterium BICA1-8]